MKNEPSQRTNFSLGSKPDLPTILRLITTTDAYRNFIFGNLEQFDKDITARKLGTDVLTGWKETSTSLRRLEAAGRAIPGLEKIWKTRSASLVCSMILVVGTMVTIMAQLGAWLFYGVFYGALVMIGISGAMSYVSNRRIRAYLQKHSYRHSSDLAHAKDFVQNLLNSLSRHFRESNLDPTKYPIELYNVDYKRIRIKKSPGFRRTYEVVVEAR